jgi:hypothetical protein
VLHIAEEKEPTVVDINDVSMRVSAKLYECENKAQDDAQRARLSAEAVTIALLGVLTELRELHETIKLRL